MTRDEKIASLATLQGYMRFLEHESPPPFRPDAYYNRHGEQIEVWWSNEEAVTRQLDDVIHLHFGQYSGRPVGVTITHIPSIILGASLLTRNDPNIQAEKEERLRRYLEAAE